LRPATLLEYVVLYAQWHSTVLQWNLWKGRSQSQRSLNVIETPSHHRVSAKKKKLNFENEIRNKGFRFPYGFGRSIGALCISVPRSPSPKTSTTTTWCVLTTMTRRHTQKDWYYREVISQHSNTITRTISIKAIIFT